MNKPNRPGPILLAFAMALALMAAACSGDPAPETVSQTDTARISLASTDLAVGENRVVFALIQTGSGAVKDARVEARSFFLDGSSPDDPVEIVSASFQTWPAGAGGVYQANLNFDRPGEWGLGVVAILPDDSRISAGVSIQVKQTSSTPAIGSAAPRSESKTASNASSLSDITTDPNPDPDLYRMTISEAMDEAKPLLVTFATPAYCRTATCGPQMSIVKDVKERYFGRMNFIHVEVYDNPAEIREQGISAARIAPALAEWGLPSEPWTFVVDSGGVVRAKYEGFVNADELESAITNILP